MPGRWVRPSWGPRLAIFGILGLVLPLGLVLGQNQYTFNEREVNVPPGADRSGVWTLDFRFKDPRLIKVNIPGRGNRICWYLWYQVINHTGEPRTFIPDFELVTLDTPGVYHDEVLPSVQDEIKLREDPKEYQDIKNSVTIYAKPVPPSKAPDEAYPRAVTGVAIWDGASAEPDSRENRKKDLSDANRFSIFVSGLSNGWVQVDPVGQGAEAKPVVRRKTLQLNFKRLGDRYLMDSREISFVPPAEWMYRASQLRVPDAMPRKEKDADPKQGASGEPRLRLEYVGSN
jgi:hypothetical protein